MRQNNCLDNTSRFLGRAHRNAASLGALRGSASFLGRRSLTRGRWHSLSLALCSTRLARISIFQFLSDQCISHHCLLRFLGLQLRLVLRDFLLCSLSLGHRPAITVVQVSIGALWVLLSTLSYLSAQCLQFSLASDIAPLLGLKESMFARQLHVVTLFVVNR